MANSLRKVQDRARRSSIATTETETERSIKALFSERIVKGRPDLFVPSTPIPTDMDESEAFKQKNLAASRRRKETAAIMTVIMYAAAIIVVLACIFAYVFDKT